MDTIFFHIDVNSAFLSWSAVDKLKTPGAIDLREIPSVIGGDTKTRHGIVLAKSIPAKGYGIETGEPIANALRKCPNLVIEPPCHDTYVKYSRELMKYISSFCPCIEQVSVDECYMDYTPIAGEYKSCVQAANLIREGVLKNFGFTVNIGISDRKVLAKMASDFKKPNLVHTLFQYEIKEKMWPLPVSSLFMCGKSSVEALRNLELLTIGDLACADLTILEQHLKSHGKLLWEFANGIDDSKVVLVQEQAKGIGNSTTLSSDLVHAEEAKKVLLSLAEKVSGRLRAENALAGSVTVEIKYASFQSVSHQMTISPSANTSDVIYEKACLLFEELWNQNPIRLLGIRTTRLTRENEPVQLSIFDYKANEKGPCFAQVETPVSKQLKLETTLDQIRAKYGKNSVVRGTFYRSSSTEKEQPGNKDKS